MGALAWAQRSRTQFNPRPFIQLTVAFAKAGEAVIRENLLGWFLNTQAFLNVLLGGSVQALGIQRRISWALSQECQGWKGEQGIWHLHTGVIAAEREGV